MQGVLLQVEATAADPLLLREVCMHIASETPSYARREDVPVDLVEREQERIRNELAGSGKPPALLGRIARGKLDAWFRPRVLVDQPFVKDETRTVGALLADAGVTPVRFVRFKVGERS